MSEACETPTTSQENYLLAIRACSADGPVRLGQLADLAGVKTPSATRAVGILTRAGLVSHEPYGGIALTAAGESLADELMRRRDCVSRLLTEVLGLRAEDAASAAHRIEHALDDVVLQGLETLVDFAVTSPGWIRRLQHRVAGRIEGRDADS